MTIAAWMLFAMLVAAGLTLAAAAIEHACRGLRLPARFVWFGAIVASGLWPAAALWLSMRQTPTASAPPVVLLPFSIDVARIVPPASRGWSVETAWLMAVALGAAWLIVSGVLVARMVGAMARLRRRREGWRRVSLDGVDVRVSPDLGPAVVGLLRPEIVLPEWTLHLDAPFRALMLRHEVEHRDAGDPGLLFAAALLWMCMPWNLAVWYQTRRLRLAVEMDCDDRVLRRHAEPDRYGRLLITIAQQQSNALTALAPTLTEPVSQLERRILAMTKTTGRFARARATGYILVGGAAIAAACAVHTPDQVTGPEQSTAQRAVAAANTNQTYFSFQVDKQVEMAPGNAAPHYPDSLRFANVGGEVIAQFVVGVDSVADMSTFKVIKSTDPRFTEAVRNAIATYRFTPALIKNTPVKQLVQQPFQFALSSAPTNRVEVGQPASPDAAGGGHYMEFKIDSMAHLARGNAAPHYPDLLRSANISGDVVAQYVVNADGHVDMSTFKVVRSSHDLFTQAVKNAAATWLYVPAMTHGHAVRQLVTMPVAFRVDGVTSDTPKGAIVVQPDKR